VAEKKPERHRGALKVPNYRVFAMAYPRTLRKPLNITVPWDPELMEALQDHNCDYIKTQAGGTPKNPVEGREVLDRYRWWS
jgi:hypothetical protein